MLLTVGAALPLPASECRIKEDPETLVIKRKGQTFNFAFQCFIELVHQEPHEPAILSGRQLP